MKFTFLGTAAAEGFPAVYRDRRCGCRYESDSESFFAQWQRQ